jgi:hypothetical protein
MSADGLQLLMRAASAVLLDGTDEDELQDLVSAPPEVLADDASRTLEEEGVSADPAAVAELARAGTRDRELALGLLAQICAMPPLRAEVDARYESLKRMMVLDPVTVAAVALLVLVIKLRKVKVGREGVELTLDPIKASGLDLVKDLLLP